MALRWAFFIEMKILPFWETPTYRYVQREQDWKYPFSPLALQKFFKGFN